MTKKKQKPVTEIRRIRRPIDDERRSQLAYEMAHVTKQIAHDREEKASEMKVFNDSIKELEGRMQRLANDVDEGMEDRDIECVVVKDFHENKVLYFAAERYPHDPSVDERAMTAEEREKLEQVTIGEVTGDEPGG